jgi:proteic killer suppression protein
MEVTFEKDYLRDLYKTGRTVDKKHRFQPEIVRKYQHCIDTLLGAKDIEVLYNYK